MKEMCKAGDIIVVKDCKIDGTQIGRHSFVVLNNTKGEVRGMSFDLACNLMSSFEGKGEEYKTKKLTYPENMAYAPTEEIVKNGHGKEGFIKAGIYYLFDSKTTKYKKVGTVTHELYDRLLDYINNMSSDQIRIVTDNLTPPTED